MRYALLGTAALAVGSGAVGAETVAPVDVLGRETSRITVLWVGEYDLLLTGLWAEPYALLVLAVLAVVAVAAVVAPVRRRQREDVDLAALLEPYRVTRRCPSCEGLGRETYTMPSGGLSTRTCPACRGYGEFPPPCMWELPPAARADAMAEALNETVDGPVWQGTLEDALGRGEYDPRMDPCSPHFDFRSWWL